MNGLLGVEGMLCWAQNFGHMHIDEFVAHAARFQARSPLASTCRALRISLGVTLLTQALSVAVCRKLARRQ